MSNIVLFHLFSKFSFIDRIYKINKNTCKFFYYFFNKTDKKNPLKDDIYELQKNMPDSLGQKFKEVLLKYYYDNNFLDLSLVFIDGHVIAYFGEEAFQKLKHSTRKKIIKALEIFNFSDKKGRIFYFKADHDIEGMRKNIEILLCEIMRIIGPNKINILVFDRGGFSNPLFRKLTKRYNIKFITLAVQNKNISKQIDKIKKYNQFKKLKNVDNKKYCVSVLKIGNISYRALLILNTESNKISPFITNISEEELSNDELLQNYSMHWNQEQEHNAFKKLGGDMHSKALQDIEFDDVTAIKQKQKLRNRINKRNNDIIRFQLESKRLRGKELYLESKIKPRSKQTDNKIIRREILDIKHRLKEIDDKIEDMSSEIKKAEKRLNKIPDFPKKKKYKYGPVDYSISMVNLANNLNSKIVEIFSNDEKKFQLATLKSTLYSASAQIWENNTHINIEYINIRQNKDLEGIQRLCDYFNEKEPKLNDKIMRFNVRLKEEKQEK